jgi:hypothetical protein
VIRRFWERISRTRSNGAFPWKHYLSDGQRVVVLYSLEFDAGSCDGADVLAYRDVRIVKFQAHLDTALMERVFGGP